jgi:hypothetical protein
MSATQQGPIEGGPTWSPSNYDERTPTGHLATVRINSPAPTCNYPDEYDPPCENIATRAIFVCPSGHPVGSTCEFHREAYINAIWRSIVEKNDNLTPADIESIEVLTKRYVYARDCADDAVWPKEDHP